MPILHASGRFSESEPTFYPRQYPCTHSPRFFRTFPFTRDENALRKSRRALASPPPPAPSSSTNPIARLPNIHADKKGRPHVDLEGPEFWDPDHGGHGKNPKYATPPRAPVRKWSDDPELIPAWRRSRKTDALIEKMEKGEVGTKRKKKVVGTAEEPEEARGDGSGRPVGAAKKDRGSRGIYSR